MYLLSGDAHVCIHGNQLVILDLRSGRYIGLSAEEARPLSRWVVGWPLKDNQSDEGYEPPILHRLLESGVLTGDAVRGKSAAPVSVAAPKAALRDHHVSRPTVRFSHVGWFVIAVVYVATALRVASLRRIVLRVRARKLKRGIRVPHADEVNTLCGLIEVFNRLRPFVYSRKESCLFHCLVLVEFLARYGIYPELVFGVRTDPFAAHAWLQSREHTITNSPLRVDSLTPILVI